MTAIFLQVRLDSVRLPNKALLTLGDRTVIEHAMRALDAPAADHRCLLTSEDSADALRPYAESAGWDIFIGPKNDVLARYARAARRFGARRIVRATGDNPLVSPAMARAAMNLAEGTGAHYAGLDELPLGSGVEVIDGEALEAADREADDPYEREHVAPFIYRRPRRFRIEIAPAPPEYRCPRGRVTLDNTDDLAYLRRLYADLYTGVPLELDRVSPWVRNNPRDAG